MSALGHRFARGARAALLVGLAAVSLRAQLMPRPDEVPSLLEMLASRDVEVRREAAAALDPHDLRAKLPLLRALEDQDPGVRAAAYVNELSRGGRAARRSGGAWIRVDASAPPALKWLPADPQSAFEFVAGLLAPIPRFAPQADALGKWLMRPSEKWPSGPLVDSLVEALSSEVTTVEERRRVCVALAALGEDARPAVVALGRTLSDGPRGSPSDVARAALLALVEVGGPEAAAEICRGLPAFLAADEPASRRIGLAAAFALGNALAPIADDVVRACVRELDDGARIEGNDLRSVSARFDHAEIAVDVLGRLGPSASPAVPVLQALLLKTHPLAKALPFESRVLWLLPKLGSAAAPLVPELIARLQAPDSSGDSDRFSASEASEILLQLGAVARPDVERWIAERAGRLDALDSKETFFRLLPIVADTPVARGVIESVLAHGDPYDLAAVLGALGPAAEPYLPALFARLEGPDPWSRRRATSVLSSMDRSLAPRFVPKLIERLGDDDGAVVCEAWTEIDWYFPRPEAARFLPHVVESFPEAGRSEVVKAAGRLGPAALPWLRKTFEEAPDPRSRLPVVWALGARELAGSPDARAWLRELFAQTGDPALHDEVLISLQGSPELARELAPVWLDEIPDGNGALALELLLRCDASRSDFEVAAAKMRTRFDERSAEIVAGGGCDGREAAPLFLALAGASEAPGWRRADAVAWLGRHAMEDANVFDALARIALDEGSDEELRCRALGALARADGELRPRARATACAAGAAAQPPKLRRHAFAALRALTLAAVPFGGAGAGVLPPTVAEAAKFTRTATSKEVEEYVDLCVAASPRLTRLSMGKSVDGRDLMVVLAADPPCPTLAAARASGKPLVFTFANIHAGEVEGKEAVQILLRELAQGAHDDLLKSLTLAFVPDYNADGNDAIDRRHRPDQAGPLDGVGLRENSHGLDLNRDYVKAEAPETRGLLATVAALDPVLVLDLHTTDGSHHGYALTYAGIMHPACDPELLDFTRKELLPSMRQRMKARGYETFDYGDFIDGSHPERGWVTFGCTPRYGTNYFGFENRLTLLSEAYSHLPFEQRVAATKAFVLSALDFAAARGTELVAGKKAADQRSATLGPPRSASLATRGEMATTREDEVLVGAVRAEPDPITGLDHIVTTGESHPVKMPVRVTFEGRAPELVPRAYAVAAPSEALLEAVRAHGLVHERLAEPRGAHVRVLGAATRRESPRPFQKHRLATFDGTESEGDVQLPAGALIVPTDQALGRLAFILFEPRSDDGFGTWGLLNLVPDAPAQDDAAASHFEALAVLGWK